MAPVPEFLVAHTIHADNMHARDPFGYFAEFEVFARIVKSREGTIESVDQAGFVRWLAAEMARARNRGAAARLWFRSARMAHKPEDAVRAGLALVRDESVDRGFAAAPDCLAALAFEAPDARLSRESLASSIKS